MNYLKSLLLTVINIPKDIKENWDNNVGWFECEECGEKDWSAHKKKFKDKIVCESCKNDLTRGPYNLEELKEES